MNGLTSLVNTLSNAIPRIYNHFSNNNESRQHVSNNTSSYIYQQPVSNGFSNILPVRRGLTYILPRPGSSLQPNNYNPLSLSSTIMRGYTERLSLSNVGRRPTTPHIITSNGVGSILSRINSLPHTNVLSDLERQEGIRLGLEGQNAISNRIASSFNNIRPHLESMFITESIYGGSQVVRMFLLGCAVTTSITLDNSAINDIISSRIIPIFQEPSLNPVFIEPLVYEIPSLDIIDSSETTGLEIVPYDGGAQVNTNHQSYNNEESSSTGAQPSTRIRALHCGGIMLGLMLAWISLGNEGVINIDVSASIEDIFK